MDVYLIPVGRSRHELYCEEQEAPHAPEERPRGVVGSLVARFRHVVAEVERERRDASARPESTARPEHRRWTRRLRDRAVRWVAERIAEQRLLWHLRRQERAALVHPDDLTADDALAIARASLQRDADRHGRWLVIDTIGFVLSGLFVLIPGPNLIAYYFAFRLVGHYFSLRGARQGLARVVWETRASGELTELGRAAALDKMSRAQRVRDIAARLKLEHLAAFFERTAI